MAIARLSLTNFRNHAAARIESDARFVLLLGDNGAGKTNVLEAVSLLTPGRGLRRAALSEMARDGGPGGFSLAATLDLPGGEIAIGTGTQASAPDRRQVRINGAAASQQALAEWVSATWLTPAMDRLFVESAGGRRRFLDRLVLALDPAHAVRTSRYERALRERNRLIAGEAVPDAQWLDGLEDAMAVAAEAIGAVRNELVADLSERLAKDAGGPFAYPMLSLTDGANLSAEAWRTLWREARPRDRHAGRTRAGPHRGDLAVVHGVHGQPAARCSTGEQKAMLIAILLAHAELVSSRRGSPPLLLLDEVAAHLDARRRSALFARLGEMGGQVWMTGTDAAPFAELTQHTRRFVLGAGRIELSG